MKKNGFYFARAVSCLMWIVVLISLMIMGCGKKSTKEKSIVPIIKSVTVVPPTIQKGRNGVVDVVVEDDANNPVSGVRVSFSVTPATIGYCTPLIDTTDGNGRAGTVFTGTDLGTATIQASCEGAPQAKTAQITVVSSTEGTTKYIEIEATPEWIRADGISTSTIKATVRDSNSTLVKDSTLVKFVAGEEFEDMDGDGYYTEGIDHLTYDTNQDGKWNAIGTITPYAFTQNGVAQVTYTAGFRTGDVYIKVTTNLEGQKIQEQSSILLVPTDTVAFIVLTSDRPTIQVKGTGGIEAAQITATCYDNNGNRVSKDFPVEFYIIDGPGGGEALNGDGNNPVLVSTNSYGEASITLLSGTKSGSVILRAKVGTVLSTSTVVIISGGPPDECSIEIERTPQLLLADGNSTSHVKVTIKNSNGNLVEDSTVVKFEAGEKFEDVNGDGYYTEGIDSLVYDTNQDGKWNTIGSITPHAFTHHGVAEVTYTAGLRTGTAYIKVTASLACNQTQRECTILLVPVDSVAFIVLSSADSIIQIKEGGMEATQVTATCYDKNKNKVGPGLPVEFSIINGPGGGESLNGDTAGSVIINTNSHGEASVTLLSGTKPGSLIVRAKAGSVFSTTTVVIVSGKPPGECSTEIEAIPSLLPADGNSTGHIKVTVKDYNGNPVTDSIQVNFAAGEKFEDVDGDGFYTEWIDSLVYDTNHDGKWNAIGTIEPYAFTHNGVAEVTYTSGLRTGSVYIKVTADLACLASKEKQKECTILLTPTDSVAFIVLSPTDSIIQVKGSGGMEATQITASCYDKNGNRVGQDFPVEFSIIDGPKGGEALNGDTVSPVTVKTNSYGEASVTLLSGTKSGSVILRAKVGSVFSTTTVLIVSGGSPDECSIEIEVTPSSLPADGISTSDIKVTVKNSNGNLVEDNTLVKFVAGEKFKDVDGDGYYTEWIDSLIFDTNHDGKWNAIGTIAPHAFTHNGVAQITYISGFRTGTVYIKVTANLACSQKQKECTLLLVPEDTVAFVVLTPDHSSIQVKGTGGVEASQITAACYDPHGNRVGKDFPVEFYISSGPQGGENLNGETSYPVTINTNSFGEATVTLLSGTESGTVRLQAKTGGIVSASTIVTICAGPPFEISLTAYEPNILACGIPCVEDSICACVVDRYGNPVPDSTSVYFGTEEGMVNCCYQTKQGCAYSLYVSGDPKNDCLALVWAETRGENGIIRDTCVIILSGPPNSVTFLDYPNSLLANGISKGHVLVEVLDANNHFVIGSTPVEMKASFGSVISGATSDGYHFSLLQTEMSSEVLSQDYSMPSLTQDDGVGAISVLTAKSGFVSSSVNVELLTGNTYTQNCKINIPSPIPYGASVSVTVIIKDAFGNPLGAHRVVADPSHTSGGSITGSDYTNEFGEAVGFTFTATTNTAIKSAAVSFCDQDPRGGVCLTVIISLQP